MLEEVGFDQMVIGHVLNSWGNVARLADGFEDSERQFNASEAYAAAVLHYQDRVERLDRAGTLHAHQEALEADRATLDEAAVWFSHVYSPALDRGVADGPQGDYVAAYLADGGPADRRARLVALARVAGGDERAARPGADAREVAYAEQLRNAGVDRDGAARILNAIGNEVSSRGHESG
ncbi:hypothetical protein [Nocardia sp. NPDC004722]